MKIHNIPPSAITVDPDRHRKDFDPDDIKKLAASIKDHGLINPITVAEGDEGFHLIAGQRRLKALYLLGWKEVPCHLYSDLSDQERKLIELEENLRRKQLTWQEEAAAVALFHETEQEIHGPAVKKVGGGWGQEETAQALNLSKSAVNRAIRVHEAAKINPEVLKATNAQDALKVALNTDLDAVRSEKARRAALRAIEHPDDLIKYRLGDCIELIKEVEDESVDLILTDPPYGIDVAHTTVKHLPGTRGPRDTVNWTDDKATYLDLMDEILPQLLRVLKPDRHGFIFFGISLYTELWERLTGLDIEFDPIPILWIRDCPSTQRHKWKYTRCYEPAFHFFKGRRALIGENFRNDFHYPIPRLTERVHPTQKPIELCEKLIEQTTLPGELILDPFAGGATTLVAAKKLNRRALGFEIDKGFWEKGMERIVNTETYFFEGVKELDKILEETNKPIKEDGDGQ